LLLSPHFTLDELTRSDYALRHGLSNEPSAEAVACLTELCLFVLEPLRTIVNAPLQIRSGYRAPTVNLQVGGSRTSQHLNGQAADFTAVGLSNRAVIAALRESALPFDQAIYEFGEAGWVHASYSRDGRRELLEAYHDPKTQATAYRECA
jgi:hypothetical protein